MLSIRLDPSMSVVPFNEVGFLSNSGSYTERQRDFSVSGDVVLIQDMDKTQLRSNDREGNATYSFRVGTEFKDYDGAGTTTIGERDTISVRPNKAVIIKTLEFVHFPQSRYGLILPKVSLLQKGISTVASKVDPGYHGNLAITVFNHGHTTVELKFKDEFCSLTLFEIGGSVRMYEKPPKGLIGAGKTWFKKIKDFLARYITIFVYIGFIIQTVFFFPKIIDLWAKVKPYVGLS